MCKLPSDNGSSRVYDGFSICAFLEIIMSVCARITCNETNVIILKKLVDKFAYFLVNFEKNNIVEFGSQYNCTSLWNLVVTFFVYQKFDMKRLFLCCNKNLTNSKTALNQVCDAGEWFSRENTLVCHRIALTNILIYYFITNNWFMFEKYLNERFEVTHTVGHDYFDEIRNDLTGRSQRIYFTYPPRLLSTQYNRWDFMRKFIVYDNDHRKKYWYDNENKIVDMLLHEKYVLCMGYMITLKECNYEKCKKKDIVLKRCKNCVSVYYCSRLCQKRDWICDRSVCKKLQSRDYSITLGKLVGSFK